MHASVRAAALLVAPILLASSPAQAQTLDLLGAYRFADGTTAVVYPNADGKTWRYIDTRTGASHRLFPAEGPRFRSAADWSSETPEAFDYRFDPGADGKPRSLTLTAVGGQARSAQRVRVRETIVTYASGGAQLRGKLVLPAGDGLFGAVVYVHGSGTESAVDKEYLPYLLAANGIAGFVFDRRGTGKSTGEYTLRFQILADDVVQSVRWLKSRKEIDGTRIGLAGFSQGGWVAPLAALREPSIRFLFIGYGMVMSVADEDRLEAPLKLKSAGFEDVSIAEFQQLNAAIHRAARNGFTEEDWKAIEAEIARYADRPWLAAVKGMETWSGSLLAMGIEQARAQVPGMFTTYFDPFYDPVPTLEKLHLPILWMIAGEDIEAPPGPTREVLTRLIASGKPIHMVVFPGTDHGLTEFVQKPKGRATTKYTPYFNAFVTWVREQTGPPTR